MVEKTPEPDKRVTITDIAIQLKLSTSTVSRALSGQGYVSGKARQRIVDTARELGYVPDVNARNLRRRSSNQIGLVVSNLWDPFYAHLAAGFEGIARSHGYDVVLILDRADPEEEVLAAESLIAMNVSGVAITPVSASAITRLTDHGLAVIQLDRSVIRTQSLVASDNFDGGNLATRHLLDLGHRRISIMIDHVRWTSGSARLEGYRSAFREDGLTAPEELILQLGETREAMQSSIKTFFNSALRQGVTAIIAANSVVSEILYRCCQDLDIAIPDDISVIGYDDVHWTTLVRPSLTVVSQNVDELGREAANALINAVKHPENRGSATRVLIQPTLLERESVKAVR
ncbi:LacI family DNA-binding transcriptional regulator [Granulosicoccus antarcticus]|uniref:HTH-type transcriptional regulator DegA n=1 Tax=Granulosicoccus antarcticus IMCC3135 TaxID=1192854 RepID=A0A2Z2NHW3_9GAMM|nr:LacI family DNA-binding transcriptional regulator [Granulosicoccus antarcticus]ASJ70739.1 HTH-type transcriptional regulator DegA [Granulosicoccus antarcticus IMCC3135]